MIAAPELIPVPGCSEGNLIALPVLASLKSIHAYEIGEAAADRVRGGHGKGRLDPVVQGPEGLKVGVSAPGSSTHNLVKQLLTKGGLDPNKDVSVIGVGLGATAVNALKSGQIDAISNTDPVMTRLEQDNAIKVLADTRTLKGTETIWGAPLPAGVLHAPIEFVHKNPNTVQALTNAIVRADKWIAKATATDVAKVVPESYLLGDRALYLFSFNKVKEAISPDGIISDAGAKATVRSLAAFDPAVKPAEIELPKTYTNEFAKKANQKYK